MKTNSFLKTCLMAILCIGLAATSCSDDENLMDNETEEVEMTELASTGENESDEVLEVVDQVEKSMSSEGSRIDQSCITITNDRENKILTIDFGTNCQGAYGRTRSGKIIVDYNGGAINDGISARIITFENYVVNRKAITGSIELRDISLNLDGTISSTKKLVGLTVTFPDGQFVSYTGSRTRLWKGDRDEDVVNNIFEITGSVSVVWSTGRRFTHTIVEPVIVDWSCAASGGFARVAGVVEIRKLNGFVNRKRVTDYGDGSCDNRITVTVGTRTFVITEVGD